LSPQYSGHYFWIEFQKEASLFETVAPHSTLHVCGT
jgi:hypothetical protein